ncbi:hypothetical protein ACFZDG_35805 [Kitasatospora xanthocidica]|uniref:hypothetical protein n=1 Tax=Kitasatospora xanthocidica TaxID=83382 RepID=UPI0036E915D9
MTARFGDFVDLAGQHVAHLHTQRFEKLRQEQRDAIAGELAELGAILLAFESAMAWEPVDALPARPPENGGTHDLLQHGVALLDKARGRHRGRPLAGPAAHSIRQASLLLRTGQDLLATHTAPDGSPRTRTGAILETDELRSATVTRVLELARPVSRIAARLFYDTPLDLYPTKARELAGAADMFEQVALTTAMGADDQDIEALDDIRPAAILRAVPPEPGTALPDLLNGIHASADRLAELTWRTVNDPDAAQPTASMMRTVAARLTATHTLLAHLVEHLAPVLPAGHAPLLAETNRTAAARWREAASCWAPLHTAPDAVRGPDPQAAEARALADRLGRVLHTDPDWRLEMIDSKVRPLQQLAAPETMATLGERLRHVAGTSDLLARDHRILTERLAARGQLYLRASGRGASRLPVRPITVARRTELIEIYGELSQVADAAEQQHAETGRELRSPAGTARLHELVVQQIENPDPTIASRITLRRSAFRLTGQGVAPQVPVLPHRPAPGIEL